MTFPEYWSALAEKNPLLAREEKLTVSVERLRAMLAQAYDHGFTAGQSAQPFPFDTLFPRP